MTNLPFSCLTIIQFRSYARPAIGTPAITAWFCSVSSGFLRRLACTLEICSVHIYPFASLHRVDMHTCDSRHLDRTFTCCNSALGQGMSNKLVDRTCGSRLHLLKQSHCYVTQSWNMSSISMYMLGTGTCLHACEIICMHALAQKTQHIYTRCN